MQEVGNLESFRAKVVRKLSLSESSALGLTQDQFNDAIRDGLDLLGKHKPHYKVYEQAGDDTTLMFDLDGIISDWVPEAFKVIAVERVTDPNTSDEYIEEYSLESWWVNRHTTGEDKLFLKTVVGSSCTLRIKYSCPHSIEDLDSATGTTVPMQLTEALSFLCVSFAANTVAMKAAEMENNSLGADQVSFEALHRRYMDVAKRRMNQGMELISPMETSTDSAGAAIKWKSRSFLSPEGRIGH